MQLYMFVVNIDRILIEKRRFILKIGKWLLQYFVSWKTLIIFILYILPLFVLFQERIRIGMYSIFFLDWFRVLPTNNLLVLRLEDYATQRKHVLQKIVHFLGLGEYNMHGRLNLINLVYSAFIQKDSRIFVSTFVFIDSISLIWFRN